MSEESFVSSFQVAIILAEPGGGKSDFLDSVASTMKTVRQRASLFAAKENSLNGKTLILDAMDEVTRLDATALSTILKRAIAATPARVLIACRAGIWEKADTILTEQGFGVRAEEYRLEGFTRSEQTKIVEARFPRMNAEAFFKASEIYEFEPLLANPQLLNIFAGAYLQSGGKITSKRQAYQDAVEYMAQEKNEERPARAQRNYKEIIDWYEGVTARLLLSGGIGVALRRFNSNPDFPLLEKLGIGDREIATDTLETQLFKTAGASQHEVRHRTIAEFCAARHLVSRIADPKNITSLNRCLALIAPNGVCRDELKGLFGWMSAFAGNKMQRRLIELDPYAVLSNGDASQLRPSSKTLLLQRLNALAEQDPLFRRSDGWRTFHAPGFFSAELAPSIVPLLAADADPHLRSLILELMLGSQLTPDLQSAIIELVQNTNLSGGERRLALEAVKLFEASQQEEIFAQLVDDGSDGSLYIAAYFVSEDEFASFHIDQIRKFLLAAAGLYRTSREDQRNTHATIHKIEKAIGRLSLEDAVWLLDEFASQLICDCPPNRTYNCFCRNGLSHIVSFLLDRYFSLWEGDLDPKQIWVWCQGLVMQRDITRTTRPSVEALRSNDKLRQAIHRIALKDISDVDQLRQNHSRWFTSGRCHAGLYFQRSDYKAILEYAFETENTLLWRAFLSPHFRYETERGPNELRRLSREHAGEKREFAKAWASFERGWRLKTDRDSAKHRRLMRRRRRADDETEAENKVHLTANRELIEEGRHWGWLKFFADSYLIKPSRLEDYDDGKAIAEEALANCIGHFGPKAPSLRSLALEGTTYITRLLYAGCVVRFRSEEALDDLPREILWVLYEENHAYDAIDEQERDALNSELERLLFRSDEDCEHYLREYIEPPLETPDGRPGNAAWVLEQDPFKQFRSTKPILWLETYANMPDNALQGLLDLAVQYGDRDRLITLTQDKTSAVFAIDEEEGDDRHLQVKSFWALRAYYLLDEAWDEVEEFLFHDPDNVFWFRNLEDFGRSDRDVWPQLPPRKVLKILNAFAPRWPNVPLSSTFGSHSPNEQKAYRFLRDFVWQIEKGSIEEQESVLRDLLANDRLEAFHVPARNMFAKTRRMIAIQGYTPPSIEDVASFFEAQSLASVEDLRALFVDEIDNIQRDLRGGDTDTLDLFYVGEERVDENSASKRLVALLRPRFQALGLSVVLERQFKAKNRCDVTASFALNGVEVTLVIEVKGQWHDELYTAAALQLEEKYSIYPGAADQGIYLVLWFGADEKVAGRKRHSIRSSEELRSRVTDELPEGLGSRVDVIVLDISC